MDAASWLQDKASNGPLTWCWEHTTQPTLWRQQSDEPAKHQVCGPRRDAPAIQSGVRPMRCMVLSPLARPRPSAGGIQPMSQPEDGTSPEGHTDDGGPEHRIASPRDGGQV